MTRAGVAVLALLCAACARPPGVQATSPAPAPATPKPTDGAIGPGETPRRDGGSRATARPGGETEAPGGPAPENLLDDDASVGENALGYLRADVPEAVVEIDAVGSEPVSQSALTHLRNTLSGVASKPDGLEVLPVQRFAGGRERWTVEQLDAVARQQRQSHSGAASASLYVLYVDGEFAENPNALGVAWTASAFAVFSEQLDAAVTALVARPGIERAVLVHELGHLLRLVNIGYRSPRPHEDPEPGHEHHSNNRRSVMYWAVEDLSVASILTGGPPDELDSADKADLADLKSGRITPES